MRRVVVVGGSLAGHTAAAGLRAAGHDGTVTVVPGATDGGAAGTIRDGGRPFVVAGDPVRPASSGVLTGTVDSPPVFCWCQVRVSVADGDDGVSSVDARVLVVPGWL